MAVANATPSRSMKKPSPPPPLSKLIASSPQDRATTLLASRAGGGVSPGGEYLHWDRLRHKHPPEGMSHEEWWYSVKMARAGLLKSLPLVDKRGEPFHFTMADPVPERVYRIDRDASGWLSTDGKGAELVTPEDRDSYLMHSLMEEAITSSQLEGAATTREVAEEMLREGRRPRDLGERMIFNNFNVMRFVRERVGEPLSVELILEIHRLVCEETLDDSAGAGRLRLPEERISVVNASHSEVLHEPPAAEALPERLERLCRFANDASEKPFIHPLVRAVILHFMIGYDHPFVDGNGRTARALFYWSVLSHGYWLLEYVSISHYLRKAPARYARAYLYSESDDNDLTYFLVHQLGVIREGIKGLHDYLRRKREEAAGTERMLGASDLCDRLNHRQVMLLQHALDHPEARYTIEGHRRSHGVAYQSARTDLLGLAELGVLARRKRGRAFLFVVPGDLRERVLGADW